MKKVVWAGILGLSSIVICCVCLFYVLWVSDKAENSVNKIQLSVTTLNYSVAKEEIDKFEEFWEKQNTLLSIIIHHKELDEIKESIKLIKASLQNIKNEGLNDFKLESTRALVRINNLKEVELPSIENIL